MKKNVLLVDDDMKLTDSLRRAFRKEAYRIHTAESGVRALEFFDELEIALVLTDEQMPGMSGTQLLSILRNRYPNTVRMLLTGQGTIDVARKAVNEGGVSNFFTKPCDSLEVAIAIRQALDNRDLIMKSSELLNEFKRRENALSTLEEEYPGITKVNRDDKGRVLVEHRSSDIRELIQSISQELDRAQ